MLVLVAQMAERISIISFMLHQSGNLDESGALLNYLCEIVWNIFIAVHLPTAIKWVLNA